MARTRGFSLKRRAAALFRRRSNSSSNPHPHPHPPRNRSRNPLCRLMIGLANKLGSALTNAVAGRGYGRIGQDPILEKPAPVPKGHMAVYVGLNDGDFERILVPVVYLNHPLFGDLLRESENEFGFDQPGGFTIPCGISEFESIQTRIKTGGNGNERVRLG